MLPERYHWIVEQFEPEGDPWQLFQIAQELEQAGHPDGAASVYDRAFGIDPSLARIREARAQLLDRLAVVEHGLCFRYVPAGPFLMGSRDGDPDEQPLHPVWLDPFWLAQTPISWADHCRLMGWLAPPNGMPPEDEENESEGTDADGLELGRWLYERNKILLQYCEDHTLSAVDWHSHSPPEGNEAAANPYRPPRSDPTAPWTYEAKPMVSVSWHEALDLAGRLTTSTVRYNLPSEAQWEKGARGGLIGARYPWGDEPPTQERCDFGHYAEAVIRPSKSLPPNAYGLYAMSGGVWEWTSDWYDCDRYREAADHEPMGPARGTERVLRGGSWADCAEAVTVSFRTSHPVEERSRRRRPWHMMCPMFGYRLCRKAEPLIPERRS
jgi:formylglycine-generating enzyme required for sulfatase activity